MLPEASRCLQKPPVASRSLPDASQMPPDVSRCLSDADDDDLDGENDDDDDDDDDNDDDDASMPRCLANDASPMMPPNDACCMMPPLCILKTNSCLGSYAWVICRSSPIVSYLSNLVRIILPQPLAESNLEEGDDI